jgi:ribosomal protein L11 methyltransferase
MTRRATALETVRVSVPEAALEAYEAALAVACGTVGFFLDEASGRWTVEGVKTRGEGEAELTGALALAAMVSGVAVVPERSATEAEGWLARTLESFPEQCIGARFAIRGTHLTDAPTPGRLVVTLDASVAFGSGEHGSTRGCLRALERVAKRRSGRPPRRILDLGTGSGILAMAAAQLLHRRVLATDIDPWSVRTARRNVQLNGLGRRIDAIRADGWTAPLLRRRGPFDLVFANILARPLCAMAKRLARGLAPGGRAILAGLLDSQVRWVLAAHRRHGLMLETVLHEGRWATLVLRRRAEERCDGRG